MWCYGGRCKCKMNVCQGGCPEGDEEEMVVVDSSPALAACEPPLPYPQQHIQALARNAHEARHDTLPSIASTEQEETTDVPWEEQAANNIKRAVIEFTER